MIPKTNPAAVVCQIAALVCLTLLVCLWWDTIAQALGYSSDLFCTGLGYSIAGAYNLGSILIMIGVLTWALSRFNSDTGLALIAGGFLLVVFVPTIPHYLNVSCAP